MFSSSDEVYDVSISWNYFQLSMTDNFCLGKWAKIERNDGKLLLFMIVQFTLKADDNSQKLDMI